MIAKYYTRPVVMPKTKQEGLCNTIQMIINQIEAGEVEEALLRAVDLLDDVSCKTNPYGIGKPAGKPKKVLEYRGDVNVD